MTTIPAASSTAAASSFLMPSWSHTTFGRGDIGGGPEHVDQVDGFPELRERRANRLAEQGLADEARIDAEDPVALVVEVLRDVERGLLGLDVNAEHRDGGRSGEDRFQAEVVELHGGRP